MYYLLSAISKEGRIFVCGVLIPPALSPSLKQATMKPYWPSHSRRPGSHSEDSAEQGARLPRGP